MKATTTLFGHTQDGQEAKLFTFETHNGLSVNITNFGGIITSIKTPDKDGKAEEIAAGFDNLEEYLKGHPHFGVIVGRFANRIAKGKFTIDGAEYTLPINNGPNHLHGGDNGFHNKLWDYKLESDSEKATLTLSYISPHLEAGYPGNLKVTVIYTVQSNNTLQIDFYATTDAPTHVNLTSHSYFNLSGFKEDIFAHELYLNSSKYVEVDETQIPTGRLAPSKSSLFDFSQSRLLGPSIMGIDGGIDHCFVLNHDYDISKAAAKLLHHESGRKLSLYCTHPGIQVYTGNSLDGNYAGHNRTVYNKNWAVCLEMQHFPDTPNQPTFPSTLLKPGEEYHQKAKFVFETM
jgi:aldose 1-epimerase